VPIAPEALRATEVFSQPELFVTLGVAGGEQIVKLLALVIVLQPMVSSISPVVAPAGTSTVIVVAVDAVMFAVTPLNFTVLENGVEKFVPVMVTVEPIAPEAGVKEVMVGGEISPITFR
jgi:hypothetical protein